MKIPTGRTAHNTLPGCVGDVDFWNSTSLSTQQMTLVGAPSVDKGITLNGTSQYIYPSDNNCVIKHPEITIICEFYPDFAYNEDAYRDWYVQTGPNSFFYKERNAGNNTLNWNHSSISLVSIASATYLPYWKASDWNTLILTGTTGSNQVYLNGSQIATSAAAWSASSSLNPFKIGGTAGEYFKGKIKKFIVLNRKWNAQEASDYSSGKIFNYRDRAEFYLPLRGLDISGTKTLDRSGKGRNANLHGPLVKLPKRGYICLGTSGAYMDSGSLWDASFSSISVVIAAKPLTDSGAHTFLANWDGNGVGGWHGFGISGNATTKALSTWGTGIATTGFATGKIMILAATQTAGSQKLYLDGIEIGSAAVAQSYLGSSENILMAGLPFAALYDQETYSVGVWSEVLTPTQIAIETKRLLSELNQ